MGIFNFYEAARRAIQDVVSPDLQFMKGQLLALSAEIRRLDEKIDAGLRFHERLARVEAKLSLSAP